MQLDGWILLKQPLGKSSIIRQLSALSAHQSLWFDCDRLGWVVLQKSKKRELPHLFLYLGSDLENLGHEIQLS